MKRRSGWAIASVALAGSFGSAYAADMPVKALPPPVAAVYNWTGLYVGFNGGYGWGRGTDDLVGNSGGIAIPAAIAGGTIPRFLNVKPEGWLAGAQAGYNWQVNQVVLGVEADLDASQIRKSVSIFNPGGLGLLPTINTGHSELDWFGTVRGRIGYAWNTVLLYATGGFAYGYTTDSGTSQTVPPPPFGSGSNGGTRIGWAAGAGFEWAFRPGWSVKGEYLHVDLDSNTITERFPTSPTDFLSYHFKHEYDMVRVGINYKLGPGPVVAKY